MMSGAPNPTGDGPGPSLPGPSLPVLQDYEDEDEEDRTGDAMDIGEGDKRDEIREQMEIATDAITIQQHCKEGSLWDRKRVGSSEESLTDKAREFIAKNKNRNLEGGGVIQILFKKHSCGPSSLPRSIVCG
jgi:hypothetical protein